MTRRKRMLMMVGGVILGLVVLGLIVLYFSIGSIVKQGVEVMGPKLLGVPVTVKSVSISPLSGAGTINGLLVGNPPGYNTPYAFELDRVEVAVQLTSLLSDTIVVRKVAVNGPRITYELGLGESNIGRIQKNVEENLPKSKEEPAKGGGKKLIIDDFTLSGAQVHLSAKILQGVAAPIPVPGLHLEGIGRKTNGASVGEVLAEVLTPVTNLVSTAVKQSGKLLNAGKGVATGTVDAIKGWFSGKGKKDEDGGK